MTSIRNLIRTLVVMVCAQLALVAANAYADPPARVARLAYIQGPVSFAPAGEDAWVVAAVNRPLIAGDRLWADQSARVELQLGSAAIRLGAATNATLLNLDDKIAQFEVTEGSVFVNARRLAPDELIEIDTPNLALTIRHPGRYRIDVDSNGDSTGVTVRSGEAEVYGEGAAYVINNGQRYRFYATGLEQREFSALPPPDAFDNWAATRDRRYDTVPAARYVAPEVIGYEDLDQYGAWRSVPEYGNVWFPNSVSANWAPYREGRWSWIEPWGWTWVDNEPWGFAPYHYGRWATVSDRWCWVPGPRNVRPVYAPALVAFVGGPDFSVSISSGPSTPVAWFPLAPGEVYRPAYHVSRDYFTRVNVTNTVVNTTIVNNYYENNNANIVYRHQRVPRAVTAVPANVFVQSRPVAPARVQLATVDLSKLTAVPVAPVAPARTSVLAAPEAKHRPPDRALRREVVAKTQPAPMPSSFEARAPVLAKQPGRPLDPDAAAAANAAGQRAADRRVRVVTAAPQPQPAPKGPDTAGRGKGQPPVAGQPPATAQGAAPTTAEPAQEKGRARQGMAPAWLEQQNAQRQAEQQQRAQQEQQKAQQQERERGQQSARQLQEQQKAQQSAREQQQQQQRAQQQATRQQQAEQQRAQQAEQQKAQQSAREQQQQQQRAQQAARQQQMEQQRAQQVEQQKAQQSARQQQQEQQRAQQAARQQQMEQQRAQQASRQQQQEAARQQQQAQQAAARQQQIEQQRAQQAARQQQQEAARQQQQAQQAARQQQVEQQRAQQAARQQQEAARQQQQQAQQAARQQQQELQRAQQEQQRAQQEQRQRARQAPPKEEHKKDDEKQAKG